MAYQHWHCHECGAFGCVRYKQREGVYEVFQQIVSAHRKQKPECADDHGARYVVVTFNNTVRKPPTPAAPSSAAGERNEHE